MRQYKRIAQKTLLISTLVTITGCFGFIQPQEGGLIVLSRSMDINHASWGHSNNEQLDNAFEIHIPND